MKRHFFLLLFLATTCLVSAQDLPSPPSIGFAFPLGSKFTVKVIPTDSAIYDIQVIDYQSFEEEVSLYGDSTLYTDELADSTIVFYFTISQWENSGKKNIVLKMKSAFPEMLAYDTDIQTCEDCDFTSTSNEGIFPQTRGTEIWNEMIYAIGISNFRKAK